MSLSSQPYNSGDVPVIDCCGTCRYIRQQFSDRTGALYMICVRHNPVRTVEWQWQACEDFVREPGSDDELIEVEDAKR